MNPRLLKPETEKDGSGRRGVQSIGVGFAVLLALARGKGPMHLREIAAAADMAPSKAYRYLVSFTAVGMAKQDPASAKYDLGPLSIEFGLAAIGRLNPIDIVGEALVELAATTSHDVHTTIWTPSGPAVIRWQQGPHEVGIKVREGTVLPLLTSATGCVWAFYQKREFTQPIIDAELARMSKDRGRLPSLRKHYEERIASVRHHGLSRVDGERRAGIDAVSAPIFDRVGIAFGVTVLGAHGEFDPRLGDETSKALARVTRDASRRLGAPPSSEAANAPLVAESKMKPSRPKTRRRRGTGAEAS